MFEPEEDDPLEFDPFGATSAPAATPRDTEPPGGGGRSARASKPLQIDFSEVLGRERIQGAQRIGAASLDTDEFMSRKEREALERAQSVPKASLPSLIELDEQAKGVRVVAENKRIWIWAVLAVLVPLLITLGVVGFYFNRMTRLTDEESEYLRNADQIHRKAAEQREQRIVR